MNMNPFALSGLMACIATFIMGIVSWIGFKQLNIFLLPINIQEHTEEDYFVRKIWAVFNFAVAIWGWGAFKFATTPDQDAVLFWLRFGHIGVIFIPILFLHFVLEFLEEDKKALYPVYIIGGFFHICNITDWFGLTKLFIVHLRYVFNSFYVDSPPGPVYSIFVAFFFGVIIYTYYRGIRALKKCDGLKRLQIKYFLLSVALSVAGGVTAFLMVFKIDVYPYYHFAIILYPLIVSYSILRNKLMDINLATREILSFLGYVMVALAIVTPLAMLLNAQYSFTLLMALIGLIVLFAPTLYRCVPVYARQWVDRIVFHDRFSYLRWLDHLGEDYREAQYSSYQITSKLVYKVKDIMALDNAGFFLFDNHQKNYRLLAVVGLPRVRTDAEAPSLGKDHVLIRQCAAIRTHIIKEELPESKGNDSIRKAMDALKAAAVFPCFVNEQLIALLTLGKKVNGEMFHQEDVKMLTKQTAIAGNHLSHTIFMEQRATFSRHYAHDMKNLINKSIESTMNNYWRADSQEERDDVVNDLNRQIDYLSLCLNDNFDLISILDKTVRHDYVLEPENIRAIVSTSFSFYKATLKEKDLYFDMDIPEELPKVSVNQKDVLKVFNNLFHNAVKFTRRGGISIMASCWDGEKMSIMFADTGVGMDEESLANIFEPKIIMPEPGKEGTGLGLIIVKDIVENHKGTIRVESEPSKGTIFYFTLPLAGKIK